LLSRAGTEGGRRGRDGGEGFRIVRGKRERAEGEEGGMGGEERDRMRRELYGIHSSSSVVPPTYVTNTYMRPNTRQKYPTYMTYILCRISHTTKPRHEILDTYVPLHLSLSHAHT
jgi:hypothetical protein